MIRIENKWSTFAGAVWLCLTCFNCIEFWVCKYLFDKLHISLDKSHLAERVCTQLPCWWMLLWSCINMVWLILNFAFFLFRWRLDESNEYIDIWFAQFATSTDYILSSIVNMNLGDLHIWEDNKGIFHFYWMIGDRREKRNPKELDIFVTGNGQRTYIFVFISLLVGKERYVYHEFSFISQ